MRPTSRSRLGIALLALLATMVTACVTACSGTGEADLPLGTENDDSRGPATSQPTADAGATPPPDDDLAPATVDLATPAVVAEPEIDTIAWSQGGNVGLGVASKDTGNVRGNNAALIYGGYQSTLENVKGWATALYKADLKERGVRWLFAIQGPDTIEYTHKEIGNTNILDALLPKIDGSTKFVLLLGHSSGSYVAHELLGQAAGRFDPTGKTHGKLVYFNLDGGRSGFNQTIAAKMRKTYWVSPRDSVKGTGGFNGASMASAGADYQSLGGVLPFDSAPAGCNTGATGCIHDSLVNSKPHDPARATPGRDYDDFSGGRTATYRFLTDKGVEAGLVP